MSAKNLKMSSRQSLNPAFLIYRTEDSESRVEVRLVEETVVCL